MGDFHLSESEQVKGIKQCCKTDKKLWFTVAIMSFIIYIGFNATYDNQETVESTLAKAFMVLAFAFIGFMWYLGIKAFGIYCGWLNPAWEYTLESEDNKIKHYEMDKGTTVLLFGGAGFMVSAILLSNHLIANFGFIVEVFS